MTPQPTLLRLGNGLRVLLQPLPGCQVVATCLHVGTGFRNEPVAGAAHLLEHVLAQGASSSRPLTDAVAATGGTMNARTAADYTQYTAILPAGALDLGLRIEHDRLTDPTSAPDTSPRRPPSSRPRYAATCCNARTAGWSCSTCPPCCTTAGRTGTTDTATSTPWRTSAPVNWAASSRTPTHPATCTSPSSATSTPSTPATWRNSSCPRCPLAPAGSAPTPRRPRSPPPPEAARRTDRPHRAHRARLPHPDPAAQPDAHLAAVLLGELLDTLGADCACHPGARRTWGAFRARAHRTGNPFDVARDALFAVDFLHPVDTEPDEAEQCLRSVLGRVADGTVPLTEPPGPHPQTARPRAPRGAGLRGEPGVLAVRRSRRPPRPAPPGRPAGRPATAARLRGRRRAAAVTRPPPPPGSPAVRTRQHPPPPGPRPSRQEPHHDRPGHDPDRPRGTRAHPPLHRPRAQ